MGRILFFILLAFCAFLALRIVAKARRSDAEKTPDNTTPENPPQTADALTLAPCPLCSVHMPAAELAVHLQQVHGAA